MEVILEVTQIGKECHSGCAIYHQIGKCIMPKEGMFAKVIRGGLVRTGDTIDVKVKRWRLRARILNSSLVGR